MILDPGRNYFGIEHSNVIINPSSVDYIRNAEVGEEGKLVVCVMGQELVLGAGPKEVNLVGRATRFYNHLDILYTAIKENFSYDLVLRDSWIDFVQNRQGGLIAGCYIEFTDTGIDLEGESFYFGPIPNGIFLENYNSLDVIYEMAINIRNT